MSLKQAVQRKVTEAFEHCMFLLGELYEDTSCDGISPLNGGENVKMIPPIHGQAFQQIGGPSRNISKFIPHSRGQWQMFVVKVDGLV